MDRVKQDFSVALVDGLKQVYGGRMPSIAVVARDFSLKSPHLPHISGETLRKWIRGESLPQYSRMQVLIEWLGNDITLPFNKPGQVIQQVQRYETTNGQSNGNGHRHQVTNQYHPIHDQLVSILDQLNENECQSILTIAQLLVEKNGQ